MNNPVILVFLPAIYIFAAVASLLQFQVFFTLVVQGVAKAKSISALAFAHQALTALSDYMIRIFGQPHKFTPQPTHVLLVALLIAVVVHAGRR